MVPGDSDEEREALGYLHVNCGNCHLEGGTGALDENGLRMRVRVGLTSAEQTDTWQTAIGPDGEGVQARGWVTPDGMFVDRIEPGSAEDSAVFLRMQSLDGAARMPPVGTEFQDDDGLDVVRRWIDALGD